MFERFFYIAPAGNFSSPRELFQASMEIRRTSTSIASALRNLLQQRYPKHSIDFCSSGTEALYRVFCLLKKQSSRSHIALSAFTCPDIATAAVSAGYQLALLDVDPASLQLMPESLPLDPAKIDAVVLSNLFGLPDSTHDWEKFRSDFGWMIVDDACQAALSSDDSSQVGSRGQVGVLSFGRGKAFCGVGGGVVLWSEEIERVSQLDDKEPLLAREFSLAITQGACWMFEYPYFYWLPNLIPGLGLGSTTYRKEFVKGGISRIQSVAVMAQLGLMKQRADKYVHAARNWHALLSEQDSILQPYATAFGGLDSSTNGGVVPIRYPIVLSSSEQRSRLLRSSKLKRYGVSPSYGRILSDFAGLQGKLSFGELPGAKKLANNLITLPTHSYVTQEVQELVAQKMAEELRN